MIDRLKPKSQGSRDLWLLVIMIVPLAIAGVIWGIVGDFSEERPPVTPTPITAPSSPEATPSAFFTIDHT